MKIDMVLRELHEQENDLSVELLRVSERHKTDHEVYHVARDISRWSRDHVRRIADSAGTYGLDLDPAAKTESGLAEKLREKGSEMMGRRSEPALLLLHDLRKIYLSAAEVSVTWELLAQGAQAVKDAELLNLTKECHPGTLRQMRWGNAMIKQLSPQALAS